MINTINILLQKLYLEIPSEILHLAFKPEKEIRSIDAIVRDKIIVDIVLMNCNLYAGKLKKVTIFEKYRKQIGDTNNTNPLPGDYSVYQIPLEMTENKQINHVLDLSYPSSLSLTASWPLQGLEGRSVMNGADEALSSMTHTPTYLTPNVILMNNNTIKLDPPMSMHFDFLMTCMLEHSETMDDMARNQIQPLSKCVLYATQMFIYTQLRIFLNQGALAGGQQLEAIKDIVDSYADASEKFEEAMMRYRGSSLLEKSSLITFLSEIV